MAIVKWKTEYLNRLEKMTNEELLEEYSSLCGGDDYDGMFTTRGEWQFKQVTDVFKYRLREVGFLK